MFVGVFAHERVMGNLLQLLCALRVEEVSNVHTRQVQEASEVGQAEQQTASKRLVPGQWQVTCQLSSTVSNSLAVPLN